MPKHEQELKVQSEPLMVKPHQYALFYCMHQRESRINLERFLDLASDAREQHIKTLNAQLEGVEATLETILQRANSEECSQLHHGLYVSHLYGFYSDWRNLRGLGSVALMRYELSFKDHIHRILDPSSTEDKTQLRKWFNNKVNSISFYHISLGYTEEFINKFNKLLSEDSVAPPAAGAAAPLTFSSASSNTRPFASGGAAVAGNSHSLSPS